VGYVGFGRYTQNIHGDVEIIKRHEPTIVVVWLKDQKGKQ